MVFPGMGTFGASKAAVRWIHEAMKLEMAEIADVGYGHPGVTRTSITEMFHDDLSEQHPMNGMIKKKFAADDYQKPAENAAMFYAVMSKATSEEYTEATWNLKKC